MRRGLTLLELLLALALVIALSAIALPAMLETSDFKKLGSSADAVEEQLLQARAHAMVTSAPVEVRLDREHRRVVVCDVIAAHEERRTFDREVREEGEQQREELPIVKRSWAVLAIDEAITIATEPPESVELADEPGAAPDVFSITAFRMSRSAEGSFKERDDDPVITLALFLPDGSAPIVEPIWLSTEDGRSMRVDIGRWTGLPIVVRDPTLDEKKPEEEVEDEPTDEAEAEATDEDDDTDGDSAELTDEPSEELEAEPNAGDEETEDENDDDEEEDENNSSGGVP